MSKILNDYGYQNSLRGAQTIEGLAIRVYSTRLETPGLKPLNQAILATFFGQSPGALENEHLEVAESQRKRVAAENPYINYQIAPPKISEMHWETLDTVRLQYGNLQSEKAADPDNNFFPLSLLDFDANGKPSLGKRGLNELKEHFTYEDTALNRRIEKTGDALDKAFTECAEVLAQLGYKSKDDIDTIKSFLWKDGVKRFTNPKLFKK